MRNLGLPQAPATDESRQADVHVRKQALLLQKMPSRGLGGEVVGTEDDYAKQADLLTSTLDALRSRHQAFEPLSPGEAARRALLAPKGGGDGGGGRSPGRPAKLSPEEQRERFSMLKYVRRIEPELPPLERPEKTDEPPPEQGLVLHNTNSHTLTQYKREMRLATLSTRKEERADRRRMVKEQRLDRKGAALALKKENAWKRAEGTLAARAAAAGAEVPPGVLGPFPGLKGAWLAVSAMAAFAKVAREELKFGRLSCRQQHTYVLENWESLQDGTIQGGHLVSSVVELEEKMQDESFQSRKNLVECLFAVRVRVRRQRKAAQCISNCLHTWQPGAIWMIFQRYGRRIRFQQHWWRTCRRRLRMLREQLSARWLKLEGKLLTKETQEEAQKRKKERALSVEAIVECKRVSAQDREEFLRHELRYRRYMLLPAIRFWEEECVRWSQVVEQHREHHHALEAVGAGEQEVPLFLFPPPRPSHLPDDDDLVDMMVRARRDPKSWMEIPVDPRGAWAKLATAQ